MDMFIYLWLSFHSYRLVPLIHPAVSVKIKNKKVEALLYRCLLVEIECNMQGNGLSSHLLELSNEDFITGLSLSHVRL